MSQTARIEEIVKETVEKTLPGAFIVELHLPGEGRPALTLLLDTDPGISIDECARISRKLSNVLDEENPWEFPWHLEVSSPGLSRPLRVQRQYTKNLGRKLKVATIGGPVFQGILNEVTEEGITLGPTNTKKSLAPGAREEKSVTQNEFILFSDIKEAKVKISMNN